MNFLDYDQKNYLSFSAKERDQNNHETPPEKSRALPVFLR